AAKAEIGRREGVAHAEPPEGNVVRRPGSDARDRAQAGYRVLETRARVNGQGAVRDGTRERTDRRRTGARHPDPHDVRLGERLGAWKEMGQSGAAALDRLPEGGDEPPGERRRGPHRHLLSE